jgi:N-acyl-D-amino-acid deacylase
VTFDVVIRNGTVVDGSGLSRYRADVAVHSGRIVLIGRIDERGRSDIDAEGHVVTPGFIDGHTHMDAQVFWDELGTSSCWHGVTSVVMGNCGFTLAPCHAGAHRLVVDNLERAEDIPAQAMDDGIDWTWETFPEYLEAVAARPKAINYAAQIGHSALRTSVMGERAFGGVASDADLRLMTEVLRDALRAGAIGFTTSISDHHVTPDGRPIASRSASWEELTDLVEVLGEMGTGIFQLAVDTERAESPDVDLAMSFYTRLRELAVATRVTTTFGLRRQHLHAQLETFEAAAAAGASMLGQCQSTLETRLFSFMTNMPFDNLPDWRELRSRSLAEQQAALRDPEVRDRLVAATNIAYDDAGSSDCETVPSLNSYVPLCRQTSHDTVGEIARSRKVAPIEVMISLALDTNFGQMFKRAESTADAEELLRAMKHPRTVMTFSDSGAHVTQISGADQQTTLLSRWVREREAFTLEEAVRMITLAPARVWKIPERGLLREGMIADINVFDPATIAPDVPTVGRDLPGGALRIKQKAVGLLATIVAGQVVFRSGEHTGELPGILIRGPIASGRGR